MSEKGGPWARNKEEWWAIAKDGQGYHGGREMVVRREDVSGEYEKRVGDQI